MSTLKRSQSGCNLCWMAATLKVRHVLYCVKPSEDLDPWASTRVTTHRFLQKARTATLLEAFGNRLMQTTWKNQHITATRRVFYILTISLTCCTANLQHLSHEASPRLQITSVPSHRIFSFAPCSGFYSASPSLRRATVIEVMIP